MELTFDDLVEMNNFERDRIFVMPNDIIDINKSEIINFNRLKHLECIPEDSEVYEGIQDYEDEIVGYYRGCYYSHLIPENVYFDLLKIMMVDYESISFMFSFSNRIELFKLRNCNKDFEYFYGIWDSSTQDVAKYNLRVFIAEIFEDKRLWSDGKFEVELLSEENRKKRRIVLDSPI